MCGSTTDLAGLAKESMEKLANAGGTSIPAPLHPVRAKGGKQQ
jgi:hypothetical protein